MAFLLPLFEAGADMLLGGLGEAAGAAAEGLADTAATTATVGTETGLTNALKQGGKSVAEGIGNFLGNNKRALATTAAGVGAGLLDDYTKKQPGEKHDFGKSLAKNASKGIKQLAGIPDFNIQNNLTPEPQSKKNIADFLESSNINSNLSDFSRDGAKKPREKQSSTNVTIQPFIGSRASPMPDKSGPGNVALSEAQRQRELIENLQKQITILSNKKKSKKSKKNKKKNKKKKPKKKKKQNTKK
jgi:hypothetical protein